MSNQARWLTLLMLAPLVASSAYAAWRRDLPFVEAVPEWSVALYEGPSPFQLSPVRGLRAPLLTKDDVTDIPAVFVADPFLQHDGSRWYLFMEVLNMATQQGDLAVATSRDGREWTYERVVLDEPFHLSYPYVFRWDDEWYMIPESAAAGGVRLYRAAEFPDRWEFVRTLVEGVYFDPSVAYHEGRWWMWASEGMHTLHLFSADSLLGEWRAHPASPVVRNDRNIARPGGRILRHEGRLYRFAQDDEPTYGNQLRAFEVTELTPTAYAERPVETNPVLEKSGTGWNALGMHHADPHPLPDGRWIAAVDGLRTRRYYGRGY